MFYILIIPSIVISILFLYKLNKIVKHDESLFLFCDIRRDIMKILREENISMEKEDYLEFKKLLNFLNFSIHYYNDLKISLFNIRKLPQIINRYNKDFGKIEKIKISQNPIFGKINKKIEYALLIAFFTYTPFIKSELIINLIIISFKALVRIGKDKYGNSIESLLDIKRKCHDNKISLGMLSFIIR